MDDGTDVHVFMMIMDGWMDDGTDVHGLEAGSHVFWVRYSGIGTHTEISSFFGDSHSNTNSFCPQAILIKGIYFCFLLHGYSMEKVCREWRQNPCVFGIKYGEWGVI